MSNTQNPWRALCLSLHLSYRIFWSAKPNGQYAYVMTYRSVWDPKLKRSKRSDSKKVGTPDESTGLITFSAEFLEEHPELKQVNVYRKGCGRNTSYTFKKIDDEENERLLSQARQIVKLHGGAAWVLDQVIAGTSVGRALHKAFPSRSHDKKLLS